MAIARDLPTRNADTSEAITPSRTGPYREAYVLPLGSGLQGFGDEGSFYFACSPTVGTGIAGHAAPVVADTDTKALLHLFNGGVKNIIPVFLHLHFTVIGANGTVNYNVAYVDKKGSTARSSAGDAITPVNVNGASTDTSSAVIYFGPVVTAMTSSRKVFQQACREVIPVVQDQITVFFGSPNGGMLSGLTTAASATANIVQYAPPVVIGPGGNFNFARIRASQSGADSYNFSFGYIER